MMKNTPRRRGRGRGDPRYVMEPTLRAAVEAVHASPLRAVLNVTGGGAQSMGWVMAVPGASKTLIEAYVPYARESMIDCLGAEQAQYVSASTARDMAVAAYRRGARLRGGDRHLVCIGCTCALASSPPKKGPHRCHVATFGALGFAEYTLTMEKGRRDRWEEDGLASMLVVQALADAAAESEATGDVDDINIGNVKNKAATSPIDVVGKHVVSPGDVMERTNRPLGDPLEYLASGECDVVEYTRGACTAVGVAPRSNNCVVLPGSFNPIHDGHRGMLRAALSLLPSGTMPVYELAVTNADKGTLPLDEVARRAAQFATEELDIGKTETENDDAVVHHPRLWLTRAPLYSQKAELMPGATFVLGHDTAVRLLNPAYYGGKAGMTNALNAIRSLGCSFIVAGRLSSGGDGEGSSARFLTLDDVEVPEGFETMFEALGDWRQDVSSTELRAANEGK